MKYCKILFASPMLLWLLVGCGGQPKETGVAVVDSLMSDMVLVEGGVFKEKKLVAVIDSAATRKQQPDEEGMVRLVYLRDSAGRVVRKTRTRTKLISSFLLSRHEVTQELWQAVMGNNPSFTKDKRLPVENVSLADCLDFVERLNEMTGREFRLPTRDEWMWAAHGGVKSKGFAYAGSNQADSVAWTEENSDLHTHDVGLLAANELGLYDMSGNVGEWAVKEYQSVGGGAWRHLLRQGRTHGFNTRTDRQPCADKYAGTCKGTAHHLRLEIGTDEQIAAGSMVLRTLRTLRSLRSLGSLKSL